MASIHRRTAWALAVLLCANIALVLVCELRCDVPAPLTTAAASCHGSASAGASSESPFAVADGAHDQCEHDALPAGIIAAIKKDVRVIVQALTGSTKIAGLVPALTPVVRVDRSASVHDDHPTRTVLRI
jgi:hypothetical protein